MTRRRLVWPVIAAALLIANTAAAQQRPLVTEDPEVIGAGLILLEGGVDYGRDLLFPASGLEGNLLRAPTLGLSFGISSIAELQLDGGLYNRLAVTRRGVGPAPLAGMLDFTGDSTRDFEDIVLGTKIRLAGETPGRPAFGLRFATKLPTASNESGLGLDTTDFHAQLLVGKTVQSSASSGTSASASSAIRRGATTRTTCWSTDSPSRARSGRASKSSAS